MYNDPKRDDVNKNKISISIIYIIKSKANLNSDKTLMQLSHSKKK